MDACAFHSLEVGLLRASTGPPEGSEGPRDFLRHSGRARWLRRGERGSSQQEARCNLPCLLPSPLFLFVRLLGWRAALGPHLGVAPVSQSTRQGLSHRQRRRPDRVHRVFVLALMWLTHCCEVFLVAHLLNAAKKTHCGNAVLAFRVMAQHMKVESVAFLQFLCASGESLGHCWPIEAAPSVSYLRAEQLLLKTTLVPTMLMEV